jgi:hypothetical protein
LTAGAGSAAAATTSTTAATTTAAGAAGTATTASVVGIELSTAVTVGGVTTVTYTAAGAALNAGMSALLASASVSLVNNHGNIADTLKELGSKDSLKNILISMTTAGVVSQMNTAFFGEGSAFLTGQTGDNVIKNMATNLVSTGISSTINGNGLNRDSLANALTNAFITAGLAQGANSIGDAFDGGQINEFTRQLAHAMLGCAGGTLTAGSSDGCAPGAVGAVVGELAAKYATETLGWDKEKALNFAKVMSAASGLIVVKDGNDAGAVNLANTMGTNAAENNYLASHKDSRLTRLRNKEKREGLTAAEQADKLALEKEDAESNARLLKACKTGYEPACQAERKKADDAAKTYNHSYYNPLSQQAGYQEIYGLLKKTTPQGLKDAAYSAQLQQAYDIRNKQIYKLTNDTLNFLGLDGLSEETLKRVGAGIGLLGIVANGKGSGSGLKTPNSQIGAIGSGGKPNALGGDKTVTFGRNPNSEYHTARHVKEKLNLDYGKVQATILKDIPNDLAYGNNSRFIKVDGVNLQYNIFKFPDGTYNVGRINGVGKK